MTPAVYTPAADMSGALGTTGIFRTELSNGDGTYHRCDYYGGTAHFYRLGWEDNAYEEGDTPKDMPLSLIVLSKISFRRKTS